MSEGGIKKAEDPDSGRYANLCQIPGLEDLFSKTIKERYILKHGEKETSITMLDADPNSATSLVFPQTNKGKVLDLLLDEKRKEDANIYVQDVRGFKGTITPHSFLRKRESAEKAEELLSDTKLCLQEGDTIKEAFEKLTGTDNKGAKFVGSTLPVVNAQGKLSGIVSEADLMRPVIEYIIKRDPSFRDILSNVKLSDCGLKNYSFTIGNPDDPYRVILDKLLEDIGEDEDDTIFIIEGENNELKGRITSLDLLNGKDKSQSSGEPIVLVTIKTAPEKAPTGLNDFARLYGMCIPDNEIKKKFDEVVEGRIKALGSFTQKLAEEFQRKLKVCDRTWEVELSPYKPEDDPRIAQDFLDGIDFCLSGDQTLFDACAFMIGYENEKGKFIGNSIPVTKSKDNKAFIGIITEAIVIDHVLDRYKRRDDLKGKSIEPPPAERQPTEEEQEREEADKQAADRNRDRGQAEEKQRLREEEKKRLREEQKQRLRE